MKKNLTCLMIDDDPDDQEIFLMCVQKTGEPVKCDTANNGVEAIAFLNANVSYKPDFIFLDVNMPKMTGIECLKIITNMDRLHDTKIFMYSTTSEDSIVNESKTLGATDFIIKPTITTELISKLSTIFAVDSKNNFK